MSNWYGINGIEFIWHGTQADAEIEYEGFRWSSWMIEDALYSDFLEAKTGEDFVSYVKANAINYLKDCLYGLGYFDIEFIKKNAPSWFEELRNNLNYYEDTTDDEVLKYYEGIEFVVEDFINID